MEIGKMEAEPVIVLEMDGVAVGTGKMDAEPVTVIVVNESRLSRFLKTKAQL